MYPKWIERPERPIGNPNKKHSESTDEELAQASGGNLNEVSFAGDDRADPGLFPKTGKSCSYAYRVTEVNGEFLAAREYFSPPYVVFIMKSKFERRFTL